MNASPDVLPSVVITTIHFPTPSVRAFADLDGWQVIVVGDRKTPPWPDLGDGVEMLTIDDQQGAGWSLASLLPFDHYTRKNLGYLAAIRLGVPMIGDSDDDNSPMPGWGTLPPRAGSFACVIEPSVVNIYRLFTAAEVWPRGLPLGLIRDRSELVCEQRDVEIAMWQGLAAGDPDVDAIYRLVSDADPRFADRDPVVLASGVVAPTNSQNTIWYPEAFPYLYLPFTVSFRFTDILRGYVAQFGLHAMNRTVGFTSPTVHQDRNEHDLLRDLADEVPVYTQVPDALDAMAATALTGDASADLATLYAVLERLGVVTAAECRGVEAWLEDLMRAAAG